MAVLSGTLGMINGANTLRNWSASITSSPVEYAASNTQGAKGTESGNQDWSGSGSFYGHTPFVMPGEAINFVGSVDGTNGITGSAIADSLTVNWDVAGAGIIEHTLSFSGNGAATRGAAAASDSSDPVILSCFNLPVVKTATPAAEPSFAAMANINNVSLVITAANTSYVDSSTAGWTKRFAGPFGVTLAINVNVESLTTLPAPNSVVAVQLFVDSTNYWAINWMRYKDITNIVVDVETRKVISCTLNLGLVPWYTIGSTLTQGSITQPGGVAAWWPAT